MVIMQRRLSGTLVWQPEMRFTASGKQVCTFRLDTDYGIADCVAWEETAARICDNNDYFGDNARMTVRGRWRTREFQDRTTGETRKARELTVQETEGERLDLGCLDPWNYADIPDRLWVLGVDPGVTTGVVLLAIPHASIFGDAKGGFLVQHSWELNGELRDQVQNICKICMRICSGTGNRHRPLIVCEDFDLGGNRLQGAASTAEVVSPVRLGAALQYAVQMGSASHALLQFQGRSLAMSDATDERLKTWGLYDQHSGPHKRDAMRHAITIIRRLKNGSLDSVLMGRLQA